MLDFLSCMATFTHILFLVKKEGKFEADIGDESATKYYLLSQMSSEFNAYQKKDKLIEFPDDREAQILADEYSNRRKPFQDCM